MADPEVTVYRNLRVASQAYTIGDAMMADRTSDAIDVVPATSSTTTANIYAVAVETVASTATTVLSALLTPRQSWTADTTNTANSNHNFQRMVLTDKATVNNTGTDSSSATACFMQMDLVSQMGTKRVAGRFMVVANITA